jgi:hypothetical protein
VPFRYAVYGAVAAFIFVLIEGGYRFSHDQQEEIRLLKETPKKAVTAQEWREMADRFKQADLNVRADWNQGKNIGEMWAITGSHHHATDDLRSLCTLAGSMLRSSPSLNLSEAIRLHHDPIVRWLAFLREYKNGHLDNMMFGTEIDKNGSSSVHLAGSIDHVAMVSSRACLSCAALET